MLQESAESYTGSGNSLIDSIRGLFMNRDWVSILISTLCATIFIPLIFSIDLNLSGTTTEAVYASAESRSFAIASLSMCLSVGFDLFLDFLQAKEFKFFALRAFSLLSLCSYSIVIIIPHEFDNFGEIAWCFDWFQWTAEYMTALWLLRTMDTVKCWTYEVTTFLILLYYFSFVVAMLLQLQPDNEELKQGYTALTYINISFYGLNTLRWFYLMRHELFTLKAFKKSTTTYYSAVIMLIMVLTLVSDQVNIFIVKDLTGNHETDDYATQNSNYIIDCQFVIRTCFVYFLCLLPGRMFKRSLMEFQYNAEIKSTFVQYISHELRTPLNILELGLEMMVTHIKSANMSKEELLSTAEDLLRASTYAAEVLDNLLLYEKVEKGTLEVSPVDISPAVFLCTILEPMLHTTSEPFESRIEFLSPARNNDVNALSNILVHLDEKQFCMQMRKILRSCAKGGGEGGIVYVDVEFITTSSVSPRRQISHSSRIAPSTTAPSADGRYVRIKMSVATPLDGHDRGCFGADRLNFRREASVDASGGGFELVLWNFRKVVALHGGLVGVSADGREIYVDLPYTRLSSSKVARSSIVNMRRSLVDMQELLLPGTLRKASVRYDDPVRSISPSRIISQIVAPQDSIAAISIKAAVDPVDDKVVYFDNEKKVALVIDDSQLNRKMLVKLMTSLGYSCIEGKNGQDLVDLVVESMQGGSSYDVVLLDNEMPVKRGRDAISEARRMGYKGIVLGVTGNALDEDIDDFKKSGVNDVILKPMNAVKFKDAMRQHGYPVQEL